MATYLCCPSSYALAETAVKFIERSDDEFLILGFEVNGKVRNEGVEAYLPDGDGLDHVLVPIGAVAEALSFHIDVNPGEGRAVGFYRSEDNIFELDLVNYEITTSSGKSKLTADSAEAHIDDIYVQARLLEEWFNIKVILNFNALVLEVSSDELLPFQERAERLRKAKDKKRSFTYDSVENESAYFLPYGYLSYPSLVLQTSIQGTRSPDNATHQSSNTLQANFDFLKFSTDLNIAHQYSSVSGSQISNSHITFRRQDPNKQILGPLQTGRIEVGDIGFPSIPLFSGVGSGAGISLSSNPQIGTQYVRNESDFILEGDAPIGWDAELYRNGQFIDFKTISDEGVYRFADLELINGYNLFKIVLYGPEGQKKFITREVFRGPNILNKNQFVYDVAIGSANTDFLPLKETADQSFDMATSANVYYGISDFLTVGANFYDGRQNDKEDRDRATTLSIASAFLGMNTQFELMNANQDRRAYRAQFRMRPLGYNISGGFSEYKNFDVRDQNKKRETDLTFSKNFGLISISLSGTTTRFLDQEDEHEIQGNFNTDIWGIKVGNKLTKIFSKNISLERFDGELSLVSSLYDVRLRGNLLYDLSSDAERKLETLRLSAQTSFEDDSSLLLNSNYSFANRIWTADGRYTRKFDAVSVDLNIGASTDDNYSAGLTLRTGMQPSDENIYKIVDAQKSSQASMGIRAYIDDNNNNSYDLGEDILKDIIFSSSRGSGQSRTNENGIAWMYGMVETPTKIHVEHRNLNDIYLVPKVEAYDVLPRKGANITLDYAFVRMGEVDGYVNIAGTQKGIANVPVRIINKVTGKEISSTHTEGDGYFVFSVVPMGEYEIIASYDWLSETQGQITSREFSLSSDENYIYDMELALEPFDENAL